MSRERFYSAVLLSLLGGLFWLVCPAAVHTQEPRYQGRTLSEWRGDLQDLAPAVRIEALMAIAHFGQRAVPILTEALRDTNANIRLVAVKTLKSLGPSGKDAVPALIMAIKDPDDRVQYQVIRTLGEIGPSAKDAIPALIEKLRERKTPTRDVADVAANALIAIDPTHPGLIAALTQALKDPEGPADTIFVVQALGRIGPPAKEAVPALIHVLQYGGRNNAVFGHVVREVAANALGQIGPAAKEAIPALTQALKDHPGVRQNAQAALEKIKGR